MRTKRDERRIHIPRSEAVHRNQVSHTSHIRFPRKLLLLYKPMVNSGYGMGPRELEESCLINYT